MARTMVGWHTLINKDFQHLPKNYPKSSMAVAQSSL
jgi:hypothetical protein